MPGDALMWENVLPATGWVVATTPPDQRLY